MLVLGAASQPNLREAVKSETMTCAQEQRTQDEGRDS